MTPKEVDFIKQTIEIEGKEFGYHKDQYALDLLSIYAKQGRNVNTIRNSQFDHLLQKPIVKELMSQKGTARLDEKFLVADSLKQKSISTIPLEPGANTGSMATTPSTRLHAQVSI